MIVLRCTAVHVPLETTTSAKLTCHAVWSRITVHTSEAHVVKAP